MGSQITDEQIAEIFKTLDRDESADLDKSEINVLLALLNLDVTQEEIEEKMAEMDMDDNKETLTLEEFTMFARSFQDIDFAARLKESLAQFDENDSGSLNRDALIEILTTRGNHPLTVEEAEDLLNDFDLNGDGILRIEEVSTKLMMEHEVPTQEEENPENEA
ncbi:hypothetical protein ACF0H5_011070 [Mactra antiquata]